MRDLVARTTRRVSVSTGGGEVCRAGKSEPGDDPCNREPSISPDGRFVAFTSAAADVVAGDTNATADVFMHDMRTSVTTRVSVASTGDQARENWTESPSSFIPCNEHPTVSARGRFLAFQSFAPDIVAGDTSDNVDVFVRGPLFP